MQLYFGNHEVHENEITYYRADYFDEADYYFTAKTDREAIDIIKNKHNFKNLEGLFEVENKVERWRETVRVIWTFGHCIDGEYQYLT